MEENNVNEENKVNQDSELKKEAVDAINQTKEQIKNINFKEEAAKGKGLLGKLFSNPIQTIKEIVKDEGNQFYKTAILVVGIWAVLALIKEILRCVMYEYHTFKLLTTIKLIVAPILEVLAMAVILHMVNKKSKQPLTKTITATAIAKIPVVISSCLGLLTFISSNITYITSPIYSLLYIISIVLMFFVVKEMFEEEDNEQALKTFVKIQVIYCIVEFALSFLGISI